MTKRTPLPSVADLSLSDGVAPSTEWEERSAFSLADAVYRHTAPVRIGKHEWRCTIYSYRGYRGRVSVLTGWEWRRLDRSDTYKKLKGVPGLDGYYLEGRVWHKDEDWPGYDHNNGGTGGMPASLRKVWGDNPWVRETVDRLRAQIGEAAA